MDKPERKSRLVMVIIGLLFSMVSLLLFAMVLWIITGIQPGETGNELMGLLTSTTILTLASGLIAGFVWYIIFRKNWIVNHE